MKTTRKILWFSRHLMTPEQKAALTSKLGEVEITHVNGTAPNVHVPFQGEVDGVPQEISPLKELVKEFDILAVVLPIGLLQQILPFAGERPVIQALNKRLFDGGEKVTFEFQKWQQVKKVEVVISDFG
jgi:hypothetical protein